MDPRRAHPSIEVLVLHYRGELPLSVVADQERDHLHALSPQHALAWERFLELQESDPERYGDRSSSGPLQTREMQARLAGDRRMAAREVEALLDLKPELRLERVQGAYKRYRTPAFVERILEVSHTWLRHNHREALSLLGLAAVRIPKIPRDIYGDALVDRLRIMVLGRQANAHRVGGDLRAADACFAEVGDLLRRQSIDDCGLQGELASLEASLRYDQRRLREADALLDRAALFFRRAGDGAGLIKVLVQRGLVLYTNGEAERAIPFFEAAAAAVVAGTEPRLALSARHNLVLALCAARQATSAREVLEGARALYGHLGDPSTLTHLVWAEGKVAAGLGEDEKALERLRTARTTYVERSLEFDAALVSLDLAEIHLGRGETSEVRRLAQRMAEDFASRGISREAARAVAMLHQAALTDAVTCELIASTRVALLRISLRPRRSID